MIILKSINLYSENDILGLNRKCDNILEKINEIKHYDKLY